MRNPLLILIILFLTSPVFAQENHIVKRVIDGDTLELENGEEVELIGIDCPEMDTEEGKQASKFVRDLLSKGFLRDLFSNGSEVQLEFDVQQIDKYGRLLAYVYLPIWPASSLGEVYEDKYHSKVLYERHFPHLKNKILAPTFNMKATGHVNLNFLIIQFGYASPMTVPPNVKYADLFQKLYQEARENEVVSERSESNHKRGLWKDVITQKEESIRIFKERWENIYEQLSESKKARYAHINSQIKSQTNENLFESKSETCLAEYSRINDTLRYFEKENTILYGDLEDLNTDSKCWSIDYSGGMKSELKAYLNPNTGEVILILIIPEG